MMVKEETPQDTGLSGGNLHSWWFRPNPHLSNGVSWRSTPKSISPGRVSRKTKSPCERISKATGGHQAPPEWQELFEWAQCRRGAQGEAGWGHGPQHALRVLDVLHSTTGGL